MAKREDMDKLFKDASEVLEQSELLRKTAVWVSKEIEKHIDTYTDEYVETLDWEGKEEAYRKLDELAGRLNVCMNDLLKLDGVYRKIAERVNRAYGKSVMKIDKPLTREDIIGEEEE